MVSVCIGARAYAAGLLFLVIPVSGIDCSGQAMDRVASKGEWCSFFKSEAECKEHYVPAISNQAAQCEWTNGKFCLSGTQCTVPAASTFSPVSMCQKPAGVEYPDLAQTVGSFTISDVSTPWTIEMTVKGLGKWSNVLYVRPADVSGLRDEQKNAPSIFLQANGQFHVENWAGSGSCRTSNQLDFQVDCKGKSKDECEFGFKVSFDPTAGLQSFYKDPSSGAYTLQKTKLCQQGVFLQTGNFVVQIEAPKKENGECGEITSFSHSLLR
mmetsp:Transcript_23717/g.42969  ORF Transcript_23717/g.42969 Transcript_23717/m.42969 type:complete len:268 (+) Transcript_23717:68-871(+)|eukprot:CAMPEP_0197659758 /NCGR_PEP_ID=MMETSP1338-20131121/48956_1 /TAXON_ID=43686 ORGANISM="Pelagodinium beii, Strain RCC1491" /NCGR_SAMPLE_ID=MMETSP1338 /ASSEMBLY_ACC=CAM_ASM_000754 /LENGTH=267 /DNA_ID=CAMNT_0043236837 /DNA_START=68 /DNA_END=871 /DNA_ORIENTATION=-